MHKWERMDSVFHDGTNYGKQNYMEPLRGHFWDQLAFLSSTFSLSFVERFILFWSVLYQRFHCIYTVFQISQTDIGIQDVYNMEDLMKMDFPPKIEMLLLSISRIMNSDPLSLCVEGLSKEVIFKLNPAIIESLSM